MNRSVKEYVSKCDLCQRNKQSKYMKEQLKVTNAPTDSLKTILIYTVVRLRPINNFRYILTMQYE